MPRKKEPRSSSIPGLTRRENRAYYHRTFPKAVGGDRVYRALEADWGSEEAATRAAAVNTFWDQRGDWPILRRWSAGEIHISDLVRAVREGDYQRLRRLNTDGVLLGDAADEYLKRSEATGHGTTPAQHRTDLGLLRDGLGDDFQMHTLTVAQAERFLHEPKATNNDEPWAARTQRQRKTRYGALWEFAREREAEAARKRGALPTIQDNPWKKAKTRKVRKTRHSFLLPEEWAKLITLRDVAGTPQAAFLACACLAGLRNGEIRHLRPEADVDLDAGLLRIQPREGDLAWKPKNDNSVRNVPIVPELDALLREHIRLKFVGRRYFFRGGPRSDRPIVGQTADDWTERCFLAAGIRYGREGEALTLHSLRHTFATWMVLEGIPFTVVAALMGNTAKEVMETYAHHAPSDLDRAIKIIAEKSRIRRVEAA